jgi:1-acyl-sn-glycerol-3-phosphate acyltransferase
MQSVVIAKPYEFVPPARRRSWPAVFGPLLRPVLARHWRVITVEISGIEPLRAALRERASVLLAPNHCRPCDALVVAELGARAGTALYTMASWHQFMGRRSKARIMRRAGAFSVYREGLDRTAVRTAIDLLVEARRPLVIFPEGIITRSNDRLGALFEGPAFIAHSAAKQRAKKQPGARTMLFPVALRYRFLGPLAESTAPDLERIEAELTWEPRPDLPLIDRLRRVGNAILELKELEFVGEFRYGTIAERLARLVDEILDPLEAEWKVKKGERESLRGCARCARRSCRNSWKGGSPTPSATGAGTSSRGFTWRSSFRCIRRAISRDTRARNAYSRRWNDWKKT